jgi:hypothetical protein
MRTDRRSFLKLFGGGIVASATMAEAGVIEEFLSWLRRKPTWSIPVNMSIGPIGVTPANLLTVSYYNRAFLANLKANMAFGRMSELRPIPTWADIKLFSPHA